ncbi:MAG: DUF4080 domain-containing protein [Anaerovoracaceae bacterium]|jgi:radical SAM superfamily enzyme YgiQ (UPF0313 family)
MKILLTTLNSKYVHSNLALKYLYAAAGESKHSIDLMEFTINNDDDYIFTELIDGGHEVICFSCYIWNIERILNLSENIKKARPEQIIVLGGPEVSFDPDKFLTEYPYIDMVISGEGEEVFPDLINALLNGEPSLEHIRGLTYREDGEIVMNPEAKVVDFEKVPFPYLNQAGEPDKILYYESARGCPYRCSYCLSSIDKKIRALPFERVKSDLDYFLRNKVKQVKFIDRTFNWDIQRCCDIISYLIQQDNGVTNFHFELCGDLIDQELLDILKEARPGLLQFEIGVQSTNKETLAACNRSCDFERLSASVKAIKEMGNIHLHLDLIAGLPHEDYYSFEKSFNDVYDLAPHHLQLGFLKLLKGSPIREKEQEHEYIYRKNPPYEVIGNKYISATSLVRLKKMENILNLYYNRGGFEKALEFAIKNYADTPFDFYEEFAAYYYLKGFQHRSHKKEDLYRIFLMYGGWKERFVPDTKDKLQELLMEDMENTLNHDAVKKFLNKGWEMA